MIPRLNCVILNYNDAPTVENLIAQIHDYQILEQIVVVDNHSSDDSLERLHPLADDKVTVICAKANGGYGSGNNLGVRYAVNHNQATHVLIANPDISVSEACLVKLLQAFEKRPQAAVVTARMEDRQYGTLRNGWPLRSFTKELLSMGPVSRRLLGSFFDYPDSRFQTGRAMYVDVVHGSMLMVDAARFLEAGGYDEEIFLYQEEAVLGHRMKARGYRSILRLDCSYGHEHSASISKTFTSQMRRQRLREESELYYMKHYLHINPLQEVFARLWLHSEVLKTQIQSSPTATPYSSDSRETTTGSNSPETVCSLDMFGPSPRPHTTRHGRKGYEGKGDRRTEPLLR